MESFCKIWQNRKEKEGWFPRNSVDSRMEFLCLGGLVARYFFSVGSNFEVSVR